MDFLKALTQRVFNASVLLSRAWHGEQNSSDRHGSTNAHRTRRAGALRLQIVHQNHPTISDVLPLKVLMHYNQACATTLEQNYLCVHCGFDKSRKQNSSAHCASHQLAALLPFNLCGYAGPNGSFDSGGPFKESTSS